MTLSDYGLVRIIWIGDPPRSFTGSFGVARAPRIGDVGTIVHAYSAETFAVECVDAAGMTLWLADFHLGELETVETCLPAGPRTIDDSARIESAGFLEHVFTIEGAQRFARDSIGYCDRMQRWYPRARLHNLRRRSSEFENLVTRAEVDRVALKVFLETLRAEVSLEGSGFHALVNYVAAFVEVL
jgi:hypothetical protein